MSVTNDEGIIIYRDVHKWYGDFHALRGVTFILQKVDRKSVV